MYGCGLWEEAGASTQAWRENTNNRKSLSGIGAGNFNERKWLCWQTPSIGALEFLMFAAFLKAYSESLSSQWLSLVSWIFEVVRDIFSLCWYDCVTSFQLICQFHIHRSSLFHHILKVFHTILHDDMFCAVVTQLPDWIYTWIGRCIMFWPFIASVYSVRLSAVHTEAAARHSV